MNIEYNDVHQMKRLNLPEILESYGNTLKPRGPSSFMTLCPFHEDHNPSLSITQRNDGVWLWHCFACRIGGTVIDFVMKKENLTLPETYTHLKSKFLQEEGSAAPGPNSLELLKLVTDFYQKSFLSDKRGWDYLKSRGIKSEEIYSSFKIGFSGGSLKKILSSQSETYHDLKKIGILNSDGSEFFKDCVVIPLLDADGNVVSLYGRNIQRKSHLYLKGPHKGLVNRQGAFGTDKIILTESILDALSLYELGIRNVIPCYGTGGFTDDHKSLLEKQNIKEIHLCFDNDQAGTSGARALAHHQHRLRIVSTLVKLPDGIKDFNDFLVAGKTKTDFENLERLPIEIPKSLFSEDVSYEIKREKGVLYLKRDALSYRVFIPERDLMHSLRVNIKLVVEEAFHVDILDLYSERQRSLYAKRVADKFSLKPGDIERDIYRILEEIEKTPDPNLPPEDKPEITPEQKEEALKSLKNPSLTQEIISDLEKIGCVGEDSSKLLGYIVTLSRKLEMPLSMIIVSQSGAGKSNLADTLEAIVPPQECVHLSRITPQALYYMEKCALKRKVLIIEEKEGSRDSDYSIRVLQSKKVLRLAVPVKDPQSGKMKTTTFEVEGPVVVIETTTKTDINPENASRCYIIYLDESEEQTKRIHAFQRLQKTLSGRSLKAEGERLIRKHQVMQGLLNPVTVHIAFVDHLKFPSKWMRTRRDYQKFLNLIEAVTFLYQHQRELKLSNDGREYIESTLEDYKIAYNLSKDIFGDSLSELAKPETDFLLKIKQMTLDEKIIKFTCRAVRDYSKLPDHLVRRYLETLVRMEYLLVTEGKNGIKFEYQINPYPAQSKEIIEGLTTPEELERHLLATFREPFMKVNSIKSNGLASPFELLGKA